MITIAIDGPSGAGKSTIADILSKKLGILHLNTGALFRAVGLYAYQNDLDLTDETALNRALKDIHINVDYIDGIQHTYLNQVDVSNMLYTSTMSDFSSKVSQDKNVRNMTIDIQRNIAKDLSVVMEGRDITSTVLPNAKYKFFVTATPEIRAKRRLQDLHKLGEKLSYEDVLKDVKERDKRDTTRSYSPLVCTQDSILIDTSNMTTNQVVDKILSYIK